MRTGQAGSGARTLLVVPVAVALFGCNTATQDAAPSRAPTTAAATGPLPDLRPRRPSFSPDGEFALRVSVTVRNRGGARARRSAVTVFLSRDHGRGDGDTDLGRLAVSALAADGSARVRDTLRLPRALRAGRYWVIACADARRRVRESSERNNCSRSTRRLRLSAAASDRTAPQFLGLISATTCVPGPGTGPASASRFRLSWEPATDDTTARSKIVYDVYRASRPGNHDFERPTYTTAPGATSFSTPPLASDTPWSFAVRARDRAGSRDANRTERSGENLCE